MDKKYCAQSAQQATQELWRYEQPFSFDVTDAKKPVYSIDTPPPTVSGSLHIGHVFSYTHTDFLARYKRMRGFNVFYPMGFDDNGLPTERFVEKKHKTKAHVVGRSAFIKLCQDEVKNAHKDFSALWQQMGLSIDWQYTYSTISDSARRLAQQNFLDLLENNNVYRTATPALYCTTCQTSVAQAELDSVDQKTIFNTILFHDKDGTAYPIATTRPELLPACVAVLYHPDDERFKKLAGTTLRSPFFNVEIPCIADHDVMPDKGTGLVMCCTFGDQTDIDWYHRHELPLKVVMDERGVWKESTGPLAGKRAGEARKAVIETLKEHGLLTEQKDLVHAVNVHERCKQPIEFRVIPQWFVRIKEHKKQFLDLAEKINWHPNFMQSRYKDWVENLGWDWCISRQRFYGVPFPIWHCQECNKVLRAPQDSLPVDPTETAYPGGACECGSTQILAEEDVMDTWNISSLTPQFNIANVVAKHGTSGNLSLPFSLRPQAHDIIRTWAFYTIVKAWMHEEKVPWNNVVISGWVLDPDRKKMSKSKGNVVTPNHLIDDYSADAIRYWAAKARLGADTAFEEKLFAIGQKLVTKLFNASKFVLMQIQEFDDLSQADITEVLDKAYMNQHALLIEKVSKAFNDFDYAVALEHSESHFWQFCDHYLELVKTRAYREENLKKRRSALATLRVSSELFLKLFAPFLPYVTEEIWSWSFSKGQSIHVAPWPKKSEYQLLEQNEHSGLINTAIAILTDIRSEKSKAQKNMKHPVQTLTLHCNTEQESDIAHCKEDIIRAGSVEEFVVQNDADQLNVVVALAADSGQ